MKTKQNQHTPGQWSQHGCTVYAGEIGIAVAYTEELVDVYGDHPDKMPETLAEAGANARLIAAAPELTPLRKRDSFAKSNFLSVKVNVDESPKLAQQFQVEGIPMLAFLQNGKTAGTSVGWVAKEDLIRRLDSLLQINSPPAATGK